MKQKVFEQKAVLTIVAKTEMLTQILLEQKLLEQNS
jgi:hypothetical protein